MSKYSQQQVHWIISNGPNHTINELVELFNQEFNTNLKYINMYNLLDVHKIKPISEVKRCKSTIYTKEQINWIKDNIDNYYYPDMVQEFNKQFNTNIDYDKLIYVVTRNHIKKTKLFMSKTPPTKLIYQEHIDWLRQYALTHYLEEIPEAFNKEFNMNLTQKQIKNALKHYNVERMLHDKIENLIKNNTILTDEQIEWAKNNYSKYSNKKELYDEYIKIFKDTVSYDTFKNKLNKLNLHDKNRRYPHKYNSTEVQWIINNYPNYVDDNKVFNSLPFIKDFNNLFNSHLKQKDIWNLFKQLNIKVTRLSYYERKPLGHERKTCRDNIVYVKVSNKLKKEGEHTFTINYRKKAHVMYEQYHNVMVDDDKEIVIHLDGNKDNFDKDNLYLINRSAYQIYLSSRYNNQTLQTKLNALKVSEIKQIIKEIE